MQHKQNEIQQYKPPRTLKSASRCLLHTPQSSRNARVFLLHCSHTTANALAHIALFISKDKQHNTKQRRTDSVDPAQQYLHATTTVNVNPTMQLLRFHNACSHTSANALARFTMPISKDRQCATKQRHTQTQQIPHNSYWHNSTQCVPHKSTTLIASQKARLRAYYNSHNEALCVFNAFSHTINSARSHSTQLAYKDKPHETKPDTLIVQIQPQ